MSDRVITFAPPIGNNDGDLDTEYLISDQGRVIGTKSPDWPFTIMRDIEGGTSAFVSTEGDKFGELPTATFNNILMAHLLATDNKLMTECARGVLSDDEYQENEFLR